MSAGGLVFGLLMIMGMGAIIVGLYLRFRNLQFLHEERMAAMEKGVAVPVWRSHAPWSTRVYLLRGLIWTFAGAAIIPVLYSLATQSQHPERAEWRLQEAKNLSENVGIPLEEARHIIEQDQPNRREGPPGAIGLLGLIPVGIGLAYLLFYFTDDSRRNRETTAEDKAGI